MDASVGDPVRLSVPQESVGTLALSPQDGELLFTAGNPRPHFWTLSGIDVAGGTNMATSDVRWPVVHDARERCRRPGAFDCTRRSSAEAAIEASLIVFGLDLS